MLKMKKIWFISLLLILVMSFGVNAETPCDETTGSGSSTSTFTSLITSTYQ